MKKLLFLSAALLLAGCGSNNGRADKTGETPADLAETTDVPIRPGLWESTTKTQVAGMPPLPASVTQTCVTPKESQESAKVFLKDLDDRDCSSRTFTMRAGKLDGQMTCTQDGSSSTIAITGTYTADTYDLVTKITGQVVGADEPMNLESRSRARRIGDCGAERKGGA